MWMPCVLLALVLEVQVGIAMWIGEQNRLADVAAISGFAVILTLGVAALLTLRPRALDKVGLRPFTSFQFLMLLFTAPPAAVLAAQVARFVSPLVPQWLRPPVSDGFPQLALTLAGLCVVPALALELVFRGLIGRAFTARFGAVVGSLLTCMAMAAAFVYPERIAEWFVLGGVLQLVFVATRSLGATIVLNALCAAPAVLLQSYPDALSIPGYAHPEVTPFVPWPLLAASGVVLGSALAALYWTRTRYVTGDGADWTPGYFSLERSPRDAAAPVRLHSPDAHGFLVVLVVAIFAGFVVTVFWENHRGIAVVEEFNANVFQARAGRKPDVPYITTPQVVVDKMLELADVKPGDVLYDLGCGDGRIVITAAKEYGCQAVGFDIDPQRVAESTDNVRKNRVGHLVQIKQDDIFLLDLSKASVITLYLLPELNVRLIPQLELLKPGCRIVSHQWDMKGVKPDQEVTIRATDDASRTNDHRIYVWTTPLKKENGGEMPPTPFLDESGRGPGFAPPGERRPGSAAPAARQKDQPTQ